MRPFDAPSGSVWEYDFGGKTGVNQFIVLDGHEHAGERRVLWIRDGRAARGNVIFGSRVNNLSVRVV